jgi:hypothetical protein
MGPLRLPRRMPAQTLVSLVFGLRCPHRARGSPRFLGHLLRAYRGPRPRQVRCSRSPSGEERRCCLRAQSYSRHLGLIRLFRGLLPTICSLAYLRIARSVAVPLLHSPLHTCRKARYRPTWLALVGRVSHPQDDTSVFHEGTAPPLLTDQHFLVARFRISNLYRIIDNRIRPKT